MPLFRDSTLSGRNLAGWTLGQALSGLIGVPDLAPGRRRVPGEANPQPSRNGPHRPSAPQPSAQPTPPASWACNVPRTIPNASDAWRLCACARPGASLAPDACVFSSLPIAWDSRRPLGTCPEPRLESATAQLGQVALRPGPIARPGVRSAGGLRPCATSVPGPLGPISMLDSNRNDDQGPIFHADECAIAME